MSEDIQPNKLITSKEAVRIFVNAGLSEATFRRRAREGKIEKNLPEGKTRGARYPEEQVITQSKLRSSQDEVQLPRKRAKKSLLHATFQTATVQDMPEMAVLLESFYQAKISVKKRSAWIERNPDVAYILRADGRLVGCAFIMPLTEEKIMDLLSSQIKPPTRQNDINLYEPGKQHETDLYIRAAGVLQSVGKDQRKHWAARLIIGLVREVINLGRKGIFIRRVYAQGDTVTGEKTLKMLGFMQIDLKNTPTDRKNFVLDIEKSGSWAAMRYKRELITWRMQNEEE